MELNLRSYSFLFASFFLLLIGMFLPKMISLVLVTGAFAAFSFFKPKQAVLLLFLYVPIRPILIEMNSGLKLIGDVVTFIVLLKVLYDTRKDWKSWFCFQPFEWGFFVFLLIGSFVGLMMGVSPGAVIFQLRTFLIMYLLYFIVSRMNIEKKDYIDFAWVTIFGGVIVSIHGIIEKLTLRQWLLPEAWSQKVLSATNIVRIYGMPGNPNSLAIFIGFAIVSVLYLMYEAKVGKRKLLYFLLVLFTGILLLSYSRGTWIALVVGLVFYLLLSKKWALIKPIVISGILGFILVFLPVNYGVQLIQTYGLQGPGGGAGGISDRLKGTFDEDNLDLMVESGRIYYIKKGFEVFKDYPVLGSGFATFGDSATLSYGSPIYPHYGIRSDIYGGKYFYSDNQYIQVIAETGVFGVIAFAVFLLGLLFLFWKRRKDDDHFSDFMIALWFSTGIMGMYYNIWELKLFTLYYFVILGAYAFRHKLYKK
ncbi:O-antigen ligase family protein [Neobacillus sp. D3-1R]|uniref:O-antigen ligase family protein n=1 Tax=Neobacillus sp. D3-1R TaxID=3445778 RepID=UPI003F9EBB0D